MEIDLDRRFSELSEETASAASDYLRGAYSFGLKNWNDLLKFRRIVILAEAGSGKTEELKRRTSLLAEDKKAAFYTTVQAVAKEGLVNSLGTKNQDAFRKWKESNDPAWFLVDSIDEAKLDNIRLSDALRKLADDLTDVLGRVHIVLSGRITDWEFRADLERLNEHLPIPDEYAPLSQVYSDNLLRQIVRNEKAEREEKKKEKALVVAMAPLDEERVRKFAVGKGVNDVDKFIEGLDAANLWNIADRPLDLGWLVEYWQRKRKFGKLAEMIDASLIARLSEENTLHANRANLDVVTATQAIERIGAAFVFGRTQQLIIPDSGVNLKELPNGYKLKDILPDWSDANQKTLMRRAVFDPATFGKLQFHNDNNGTICSYLAAKWLSRMKENNCSTKTILNLFFVEQYGLPLIRPSLQQTASWLALWDEDVANGIVSREPLLLLSSGDPSSLSLETREKVLNAVVARMTKDGEEFSYPDKDSLRRFSLPDISPRVIALWKEYKDNEDVRQLLLQMIGLGKLSSCVSIAEEVAFANTFPDKTAQVFAGRAIFAISSEENQKRYATIVKDKITSLPSLVIWESFDAFFPKYLTTDDLICALEKMGEQKRNESYALQINGPRLVERLTSSVELEKLLHKLLALYSEVPKSSQNSDSPEKAALSRVIAAAVSQLMKIIPDTDVSEAAMDAALLLGARNRYIENYDEEEKIAPVFEKSLARRRAMFWRAFEKLKNHRFLQKGAPEYPWQMDHLGWRLSLTLQDIDWLIEDATETQANDVHVLAVNTALTIWRDNGKNDGLLNRIKQVVRDGVSNAAIAQFTNPPTVSLQDKKWQREVERSRKKREQRQNEDEKSLKEFIAKLRSDPGQLDSIPDPTPNKVDARIFHLWHLLQQANGSESKYAIDDVSPLIPLIGKDLAAALQRALIKFWRKWKPTLAADRAADKKNTISLIDCMGITGVSLEAAADPNWASKLTPEEAKLAACYATIELNGFPKWFAALSKTHPTEVQQVLMHEVCSEIQDSSATPVHGTLQTIYYAGASYAFVVADALYGELKMHPKVHIKHLRSMLNLIADGLDKNNADFLTFVLKSAQNEKDSDVASVYLEAAFKLNPAQAIKTFRMRLNKLSAHKAKAFAETVFANGFGGRFSEKSDLINSVPYQELTQLIKIAYDFIKPKDDRRHASGVVYSPDLRDDAEHVRNALFNRLVEYRGAATFACLMSYANKKSLPISADRLKNLAKQRALNDSEHSAWNAGDAHQFETKCTAIPRTPTDLQETISSLISDIQHDLHNSRFSQGNAFKALKKEKDVQKWVADRLEKNKGKLFSLEREPHVVEEKEPDIRIQSKASDASLPIEIKVTESWSLKKLEEALITQLGKRYLRERDHKHGILLLVHQKKRVKGWKNGRYGYLTFHELVAHLQKKAAKQAEKANDAPQAKVVAIDVSDITSMNTKKKISHIKGKSRTKKRALKT